MKLSTAAILCTFLPKISQAVFPLREVLRKMTSANALDTTLSAAGVDVQSSFDKAKALLTTVPVEGSFKAFLNKVVTSKRCALAQAIDNARALTTTIDFSSVLGATSPTQWALLLSSMAPISFFETIVASIFGESLTLEHQNILRAFLQEYQVLARVVVTSMSLPPQYTKAVWITYAATKALPQRSLLSLLVSAIALLRGDLGLQGFNVANLSRTQVSALLAGVALLPPLFYGLRSIESLSNHKMSRFVLSDCLWTLDDKPSFQVAKPMVLPDSTTEFRASLASVPLKRLVANSPTTDRFMDTNINRYTKPAIQLWRIGTSVQFWQSIYHAVKQDEYYCLVEDEQEPVAIA